MKKIVRMKPYYRIVDLLGIPCVGYNFNRRGMIQFWVLGEKGKRAKWSYWRKLGYRCVRVVEDMKK